MWSPLSARVILLAVLMAPAPASGRHPVAIYCGPGLGNCGPSPAQVRYNGISWADTSPGVKTLVGTRITVEYDIVSSTWDVKRIGDGDKQETRGEQPDLESAKKVALQWALDMVEAGIAP